MLIGLGALSLPLRVADAKPIEVESTTADPPAAPPLHFDSPADLSATTSAPPSAARPSLLFPAQITLGPATDSSIQTVAVPRGLTATRFSARVSFPITSRPITFAVSVDGERIATAVSSHVPTGMVTIDVALPALPDAAGLPNAAGQANAAAPTSAQGGVTQRTVSVELATSRDDSGIVCLDARQAPVRVLDAGIVTTGQAETPATIADFFDSTVKRVDIWSADVTTDPAAVQMAASVVHRLGSTTVIGFRRGALDAARREAATANVRAIVFGPAVKPATTIVVGSPTPTLSITGPEAELLKTARALAEPAVDVADTSVSGAATSTDRTYGRTSLTVAQLTGTRASVAPGRPGPQLIGTGEMTWQTAVSQARFGGPVGHVSVNLVGRSTPVDRGAVAVLSLLWNGGLVSSTRLRNGGAFAVRADIPTGLIGRENTFAVRVAYTPTGGRCSRSAAPIEVDIDPLSSVVGEAGQTLPAGFTRFPQVLKGSFRYAIDGTVDGTKDDGSALASAGGVLAALQRLSPDLLLATHVSMKQIADGTAGVVVNASPTTAKLLGAPFQFGQSRVITADARAVSFEISGPVGSLQAFDSRGTNLIVAGGTTPALAEGAVAAMIAHADGWYHLADQIQLLRTPRAELIGVPNDAIVPAIPDRLALTAEPASGSRTRSWLFPVVLTLLAILVARALIDGIRLRRLRSHAARVAAHERGDAPVPPEPSASAG